MYEVGTVSKRMLKLWVPITRSTAEEDTSA